MATNVAQDVESKRKMKVQITSNAQTVLQSRYLKKDKEGRPIETPEELYDRVASAIAQAEKGYGLSDSAVETVHEAFYDMMARGEFLPNSPTLMNAGRSMGMLSACFVLPVEDSIDGIFSSVKNTALIQKAGGGTGFSFSRLRPEGDAVNSSGGTTSGPISFMKVFSEATNAIQQGAFRRGANMGMMRIDHPNIVEFIDAKQDLTKLTNFNLSVSMTDKFMDEVKATPEKDHTVVNPRTGKAGTIKKSDGSTWKVGELFNVIVNRAWQTGEPGMVFIDRMNRDNPTPHIGTIEATNPCGEQPLLPYESCNLGSVCLTRFIREGADSSKSFDFEAFARTIHLATRFLDDVIDINRYPVQEITNMTRGNRKIGLGLMGFADVLYALGIPYNSDEGVEMGERLMRMLNNESHLASQKLAEERGVFPNWKGSTWDTKGIRIRNACTTTVAPTGTISIIANSSGGIEPLFSLVFFRNILNGQRLAEVNQQFEDVARRRGFYSKELMERVAEEGSIQHIETIPDDVKHVFVTAHDISPEWHMRMQAAFQRHCDASISKTINFDKSAAEDDVRNIFLMAYQYECKGVTVYRNGCRENQPMSLSKSDTAKEPAEVANKKFEPVRPMSIPEIMPCIKIKQMTPFGNMHVKIVVDAASGQEREVFATLGKGGDVVNSDLEAISRLISLYLRVNGSIDDVLSQLSGIGTTLGVATTKDGRISSLPDGIAAAIKKYRIAKEMAGLEALLLCKVDLTTLTKGLKIMGMAEAESENTSNNAFKVKCPECTAHLSFEEGCIVCHSCGYSKC